MDFFIKEAVNVTVFKIPSYALFTFIKKNNNNKIINWKFKYSKTRPNDQFPGKEQPAQR